MTDHFVNLHLHTSFSLSGGLCPAADAETYSAAGITATAVTDTDSMVAFPQMARSLSRSGIKVIPGLELTVNGFSPAEDKQPVRIVLLAENNTGYENLCRLASLPAGFAGQPELARYHEGIIALSGGLDGILSNVILQGSPVSPEDILAALSDIFGKDHFYIELMYHGDPRQKIVNRELLKLSKTSGIPCVVTNDVRFISSDHAASYAMLESRRRGISLEECLADRSIREHYLKSGDDLLRIFKSLPDAVNLSGLIADRCIVSLESLYGNNNSFPELDDLCRTSFASKYGADQEAAARLEQELKLIHENHCEYDFLKALDCVKLLENAGIGYSGNAGYLTGSIAAHVLGITSTDPVSAKLLFHPNGERRIEFNICADRANEFKLRLVREFGAEHILHPAKAESVRLPGSQYKVSRVSSDEDTILICPDEFKNKVPVFEDETEPFVPYQAEDCSRFGGCCIAVRSLHVVSMIHETENLIRRKTDAFSVKNIPSADAKTASLLAEGKTGSLFQLDTRFASELCRRLHPEKESDLSDLIALSRIGSEAVLAEYVRFKDGAAPAPFLYRDDAIQYICKTLNVSFEDAVSVLDDAARDSEKTIEGIPDAELKKMRIVAGACFDHAEIVCSANLAWQTAYLKAVYPLEYFCTVLNESCLNGANLNLPVRHCLESGISFLKPDVFSGIPGFAVEGDQLRFGLCGIRNVGVMTANRIVEACRNGAFLSFPDFCRRTDISDPACMESLIRSGALDSLNVHRSVLLSGCDSADIPELSEEERLLGEKENLGCYVTGHPLDGLKYMMQICKTVPVSALNAETVRLCGIIEELEVKETREDRKSFCVFQLTDRSGRIDCVCFNQIYEQYRECLTEGNAVYMKASVKHDDESRRSVAVPEFICPAGQALSHCVKEYHICIDESLANAETWNILGSLLQQHSGTVPVKIELKMSPGVIAEIGTSSAFSVTPSENLDAELTRLYGTDSIHLILIDEAAHE